MTSTLSGNIAVLKNREGIPITKTQIPSPNHSYYTVSPQQNLWRSSIILPAISGHLVKHVEVLQTPWG